MQSMHILKKLVVHLETDFSISLRFTLALISFKNLQGRIGDSVLKLCIKLKINLLKYL